MYLVSNFMIQNPLIQFESGDSLSFTSRKLCLSDFDNVLRQVRRDLSILNDHCDSCFYFTSFPTKVKISGDFHETRTNGSMFANPNEMIRKSETYEI